MTLTTALAVLSGWATACDTITTVGRWAADNTSTWGVLPAAAVASWATYGWQQRGRRRRIAAALAAETARLGPGWANNAASGDGWPVDVEAIARLHTDIHYGAGFVPEPGSDPWLVDLLALEMDEEEVK